MIAAISVQSGAPVFQGRGGDLKQVGDWVLDIDPKFGSCSMSANYDSGAKVVVTYNHRRGIVKVGFTEAHASSFIEGTTRPLTFYLFRGDDVGRFADLPFTALATTDGKDRLIMSGNLGARFFGDLVGKESISFWYQERPVASFELKDLDYTMTQLRKCAVKADRLPTVDPFAE